MPEPQRQAVRADILAQQRALIPPSVMDFPLQRLVVTAIFGLLQTIKVFYSFRVLSATYHEQYNGICGWWWTIDALFILTLYILRIPWLQFSTLKSFFLITVLMTVDVLLFMGPQVKDKSDITRCE